MPIDLESLVQTVGYPGLFLIIFAETGLLIGFMLPGDTLLITTGFLAQRGTFEVWILIPLLIVAAVLGDATGFEIGKNAGPRIFTREDSRFFKKSHLQRAHAFYEKHGGKTIFLARFLAFIRTFAPTVAGAAGMEYRKFAVYNISGGVAWILSMVLMGYYVGEAVPNVELFMLLLVGFFFAVSLAPAAWHVLKTRREAARAAQAAKPEPEFD
ncbi:MAG: DedA family protein [Hyphomicrobiales bacterium]